MKVIIRCFIFPLLWITFFIVYACDGSVNYTPPAGSSDMAITHYSFGLMTIDGKNYWGDLSILPGGEVKNWIINRETHILETDDIAPLLSDRVKTLIIGTGSSGSCELSDELKKLLNHLEASGTRIVVEKTDAAVMEFNKAAKEGLLACFHLNC